jgi:CBS domain containing-hemolysin-like protein
LATFRRASFAFAMTLLLLAIALTCTISFVCSLSEAMILSTTVSELEALKKKRPRRGAALERLKTRLEETTATILTLNTIANTLGSVLIGGLAMREHGQAVLGVVAGVMTLLILVCCEIIPKNLGVSYRRALQPVLAYPIAWAARCLRPVTWISGGIVRLFVGTTTAHDAAEEEIRLLAERGARHGTLNRDESDIIANALRLDDVRVASIMTPRSVLGALKQHLTIGEVFRDHANISFGRMPVYGRGLDDIVGLVRRRDLLKAKAQDLDADPLSKYLHEINFVPETATVSAALKLFLEKHQRLLVVVDEFGSTAGVVTMEDVMEHLLGQEIFEKDDVAVDMRELARSRTRQTKPASRISLAAPSAETPPPATRADH